MVENPLEREAMKEKMKKIAREEFDVDKMLDEHIKVYRGK